MKTEKSAVARKLDCPSCGSDMRSRSLLYSMKPYRVCPDCHAKYTSDPDSRRRQLPIAILSLIVLGLSIAISLDGAHWLVPAILSYIALLGYVAYALSKLNYVKYLN
jgi:uncharacterized protein (DUF983 family)